MATNFGKRLRRIRVDQDLTLRAMAEKLGVSATYLSGIENGKYAVSDNFFNTFIRTYDVPEEEISAYKEDAKQNQAMINSAETTNLINALARSKLTLAELEQIKDIIKSKESE